RGLRDRQVEDVRDDPGDHGHRRHLSRHVRARARQDGPPAAGRDLPVGVTGSLLEGENTMSGSADLPFTGSLFTLPLILIGLTLTFSGWLARRVSKGV